MRKFFDFVLDLMFQELKSKLNSKLERLETETDLNEIKKVNARKIKENQNL